MQNNADRPTVYLVATNSLPFYTNPTPALENLIGYLMRGARVTQIGPEVNGYIRIRTAGNRIGYVQLALLQRISGSSFEPQPREEITPNPPILEEASKQDAASVPASQEQPLNQEPAIATQADVPDPEAEPQQTEAEQDREDRISEFAENQALQLPEEEEQEDLPPTNGLTFTPGEAPTEIAEDEARTIDPAPERERLRQMDDQALEDAALPQADEEDEEVSSPLTANEPEAQDADPASSDVADSDGQDLKASGSADAPAADPVYQRILPTNQYRVVVRKLNLRSSPEISEDNIIGSLYQGDVVTKLSDSENGFSLIRGRYGVQGYVPSRYLVPYIPDSNPEPIPDSIVSTNHANYSYEQMLRDIQSLIHFFPSKASSTAIGTSVLGRKIPALVVGNPNAPQSILFQAAIHGREHMTTPLVMAQAERLLKDWETDMEYWGIPLNELLNEVKFVVVPMSNPDGVMLSQQGLDSVSDPRRQEYLLSINNGSSDFTQWKANANGVDLNRNFAGDWRPQGEGPGPAGYSGPEVWSEPESRALRNLTQSLQPLITNSYHARGEVIFWYFMQTGMQYIRDEELAAQLSELTGYASVPPGESLGSYGGYKDWFIEEFGLPGFTMEIGDSYAPLPLPESQWDQIYRDNRDVALFLLKTAYTG